MNPRMTWVFLTCPCMYFMHSCLFLLPVVLDQTPCGVRASRLRGGSRTQAAAPSLGVHCPLHSESSTPPQLSISCLLTTRSLPVHTLSLCLQGFSQWVSIMAWPRLCLHTGPTLPTTGQQVVGPPLSSRALYSQVSCHPRVRREPLHSALAVLVFLSMNWR